MRSLIWTFLLMVVSVEAVEKRFAVTLMCNREPMDRVKVDLFDMRDTKDEPFGGRYTTSDKDELGTVRWFIGDDGGEFYYLNKPYIQIYNTNCTRFEECLMFTTPTYEGPYGNMREINFEFTLPADLNKAQAPCRQPPTPEDFIPPGPRVPDEEEERAARSVRLMAAHNRIVGERQLIDRMLAAAKKNAQPKGFRQPPHLHNEEVELLKPAQGKEKDPTQRTHNHLGHLNEPLRRRLHNDEAKLAQGKERDPTQRTHNHLEPPAVRHRQQNVGSDLHPNNILRV